MIYELILYFIIFIYGIVIGSFLNVCIFRIPKKADIARERSHCMSCGHQLGWYDLVPLFSWLFLKGRCRYCKSKISVQYPLIEFTNGIGYVLIFLIKGLSLESVLGSLLFSALLTLSIIDIRTREIPFLINIIIFILGSINLFLNISSWQEYVIGLFAVSGFLMILFLATSGRGIGGGDIKLMACAGLFLGWEKIIFALVAGCIAGSIIHIFLMIFLKKGRELAFGPYLAFGIFLSFLYGEELINWYIAYIGM